MLLKFFNLYDAFNVLQLAYVIPVSKMRNRSSERLKANQPAIHRADNPVLPVLQQPVSGMGAKTLDSESALESWIPSDCGEAEFHSPMCPSAV